MRHTSLNLGKFTSAQNISWFLWVWGGLCLWIEHQKLSKYCRSRHRRDLRNLLRLPGTKWCGKGYSALKYAELGGRSKADRCCRQHDKSCPYWIMGFETKYGLFNWRINTLMHCKCDHRYQPKLRCNEIPLCCSIRYSNVIKIWIFFLLILCFLRFDLSLSNQFYTLNARYDVYLHFRHEKELSDFRICIAVPFLWHVSCSEMPNHGNSCVFSGHQLIWNPFKRVTRSHLIHFECFSVVFNSTFTTNPMFFFLVNRMKIKETTLFRIIVQVIHFKKGFALFSYRH